MKFSIISGIFFLLGSLIGADPSCKSSPCISVDFYYGSLCVDSINFIKYKLAPSYAAFKDHLDLNFFPYGKARHTCDENGKWAFRCQHKDPECRGNKAHACALNVIEETSPPESKQEDSFKLIKCALLNGSPERSPPRCASYIGLSESIQQKIIDCIESSAGDDLLAAHGDKTRSFLHRVRYVPTIVINGIYSREKPKEAFRNFKENICNLLKEGGKNLKYCASFDSTE